MLDLNVNKSAFGLCYDALKALSSRLRADNFTQEPSEDTSLTGEKEKQCYEELIKMKKALADLADETARDVRTSQARYVLADQ